MQYYIALHAAFPQYLLLLVDTQTHTQIAQTVVPVDGADTGDAVIVTHSLGQEPVPDLPGKHGGVLAFVIGDLVDHFGSSNLWFGSPDYPGADTARFIVPAKQSTEEVCIGHEEHRKKSVVFLEEASKLFICVSWSLGSFVYVLHPTSE